MDALYLPDDQAYLRYTSLPGRAPALVYLTGLGIAVAGTYDHCVADPALAAQRTLLVDVLGAGFSDAPETFSYSLEDHARTIATLLDHLHIAAATVIGYSFGGAVAITLAATRPELVGRLVLPEANLDPGGGVLSRRIAGEPEAEFRARGFDVLIADSMAKARRGDGAWAITIGMLQTAAPHALHRSAVGLVNGTRPPMRERLLRLPIPRAIIRGEASGPNRREEELVAAGLRLHVVPRATHGMMWENPDGFVAALKAALAGAC
jgi:pimeloyl-ACP methyl ester carboxylesterase